MATTTVIEQIPSEILEDIRDAVRQASQRSQEAEQHRIRSIHLDGEAAGFRASVDRIVERKLRAGKEDQINIETGTITRVVEVADPAPVDPPSPPPSDWFEPPANERLVNLLEPTNNPCVPFYLDKNNDPDLDRNLFEPREPAE